MQVSTIIRAALLGLMLHFAPAPLAAEASPAERAAALETLDTWYRLRRGDGTPSAVQTFFAVNAGWPAEAAIRRAAELRFEGAAPGEVRLFFAENQPQTPEGALALADALEVGGLHDEAHAVIARVWREMALNAELHDAILERYSATLTPALHRARLDLVLWRRWEGNIARMLPLVDDDHKALAQARMALKAGASDAEALVRAVPKKLRGDPGLAYERFLKVVASGTEDAAAALLDTQSTSAARLGRPKAWAGQRRSLARQLMRSGKYERAYALAARHHLAPGSDFADLEWLAGFLALRFLDRPDHAVTHFENFLTAVESPISVGRGGYWLGRAQAAAGNSEAAQAAYEKGGAYQTSFYGLLAAEAAGLPPDPKLGGAPAGDWRAADVARNPVFLAADSILSEGSLNLAEYFFTHLTDSLNADEVAALGAYLQERQRPHLQVMVGKRAARRGIAITAPYYALHPMALAPAPINMEMMLAIARRESEFDPVVVSPVGARGLMQVMPATGRHVAEGLGISFNNDRMLTDWRYNAVIGGSYLGEITAPLGGNVILTAAAYNAGPGRPVRWMARFGDPRTEAIDMVDWIELIPFNETRNYVMRVAESLPVYRARLLRDPLPVPFSEEISGSTLRPRPLPAWALPMPDVKPRLRPEDLGLPAPEAAAESEETAPDDGAAAPAPEASLRPRQRFADRE